MSSQAPSPYHPITLSPCHPYTPFHPYTPLPLSPHHHPPTSPSPAFATATTPAPAYDPAAPSSPLDTQMRHGWTGVAAACKLFLFTHFTALENWEERKRFGC
ncbi:hypothetical protein E2C01_051182 [Portunus trituberculatus]|uniref:Uncharacterized protein n=1 Tax=Portunus trituberculatus TaxID=210409 RepID=A0A5B7GIW5_PORTR|nr:hypothetical protein [Portunus trituberculatus]